MRLRPCLAGLAVALSLAAQPAQAGGCPAKSTRFEDIVVALNEAPGCEKAQQVFEACRYEDSSGLTIDQELCRGTTGRVSETCQYVASRVDELNAIVKKKCDAEAAKLPPQEACPAKSTMMDDVIAALNEAPSCDRARKVFEACEYGTSGDIQFGAVVEKKCEGDFVARLKDPAETPLSARTAGLRLQVSERARHDVPVVYGLLPGRRRPALFTPGAESLEPPSIPLGPSPQAASAALAFSAMAWNAAGSLIARSDSTLRSTVMPDFDRPLMKTL